MFSKLFNTHLSYSKLSSMYFDNIYFLSSYLQIVFDNELGTYYKLINYCSSYNNKLFTYYCHGRIIQ